MYFLTLNIDDLKKGTRRQQLAHAAILESGIFRLLRSYNPVLAGTIPIDVDLDESDLDIICCAENLGAFERDASHMDGFELLGTTRQEASGRPSVALQLRGFGFLFELFGQTQKSHEQDAVLHMVAEGRLLHLAGEGARSEIRNLRKRGLKTEPAFAAYFNLSGDPYRAVRDLASAPIPVLEKIIARADAAESV